MQAAARLTQKQFFTTFSPIWSNIPHPFSIHRTKEPTIRIVCWSHITTIPWNDKTTKDEQEDKDSRTHRCIHPKDTRGNSGPQFILSIQDTNYVVVVIENEEDTSIVAVAADTLGSWD